MPGVIDRLDMVRDSTMQEISLSLAAIANNTGGFTIKGWKNLQAIIRSGLAKRIFKAGDLLVVERESAMTATIGTTEETPGITEATVNPDTFINRVGTVHAGEYEFIYDGAEWHLDGAAVTLSDYGITVTGTAITGDVVIIRETADQIKLIVYDVDKDVPADTQLEHSLTVGFQDCFAELQFDNKEAMFAFDEGLAAGTYHFTVGAQPWVAGDVGKVVQFTLASDIPAGGQIVFGNAYNATMVGATISVYASPTATAASETATLSEGTDGTDLGTLSNATNGAMNSVQRGYLGSNNYNESAIRQYLNSDKAAGSVWTPQTKWDRPPSWAASTAGLLYRMDPEFVSVIGKVKKRTAKNTVSDGGGYIDTEEKVFLLSRTEVYAGTNNSVDEGGPYRYFSEFSDLSSAGTGADSNRTKYRNNVAKYWWLRSPYTGSAGGPFGTYPSGTVGHISATYSFGAAPACCIV